MVRVDLTEANRELEKLRKQLSKSKVASVTRMSLNEGIRKAKVETKNAITSFYNIKAGRINDSNPKKGLSVKLAKNNNLSAEVDAGHIPINLSEASPKFKGATVANQVRFKKGKAIKGKAIRRSKSTITVEVEKGKRKELATAFTIGVATHATSGQQFTTSAIFARGKKGKPKFQFGKNRYPIDSMSTVSVATAAMNTKAQEKVQPIVNQYLYERYMKHLKYMIDKG